MYVCLCARIGVGKVVKEIGETIGILYGRAMHIYAVHSGSVGWCYLKVDLKVDVENQSQRYVMYYLTVKVNVKDKTNALVQNTEAQALAQVETTAQTKAMAIAITRAELEPKGYRWLRLWSRSWSLALSWSWSLALSWSWSWSWPWPWSWSWSWSWLSEHTRRSPSHRGRQPFNGFRGSGCGKRSLSEIGVGSRRCLQECAKPAWSALFSSARSAMHWSRSVDQSDRASL